MREIPGKKAGIRCDHGPGLDAQGSQNTSLWYIRRYFRTGTVRTTRNISDIPVIFRLDAEKNGDSFPQTLN